MSKTVSYSNRDPSQSGSGVFIAAVATLIGTVLVFVIFLSKLPTDYGVSVAQSTVGPYDDEAIRFDYYRALPEQIAPVSQRNRVARPSSKPLPEVEVLASGRGDPIDEGLVSEPPRKKDTTVSVAEPLAVVTRAIVKPSDSVPESTQQLRHTIEDQRRGGQDAYFFEMGRFAGGEQAVQSRAALQGIGLRAFVIERKDPNTGARTYRVRVGPLSNQSQLELIRTRLREYNISHYIIRTRI